MATPWRMARSLEKLRAQINAYAPNRSKAADGGIGDAAHASRSSDHNPHVKIGGESVVTARDFTHDPAGGLDCNALVDALVRSADPRIKYIIWNRQIVSGTGQKQAAWKWRKYTGANGHTKHAHISVKPDVALIDSEKDWAIPKAVQPAADPQQAILQKGATGKYVTDLQRNLTLLGYPTSIDGKFGGATEAAVKAFQSANNLLADGIAGIRTNTAIGEAIQAKETAPKIAAAKKAVEPAAKDGIGVNEIGGGLISVAPAVAAAKQVVEDVAGGVTSLMALGPWIIAAAIGVVFGAYVIWSERQKKAAARKALEALK